MNKMEGFNKLNLSAPVPLVEDEMDTEYNPTQTHTQRKRRTDPDVPDGWKRWQEMRTARMHAKVVAVNRKSSLSALYLPKLHVRYMEQVFWQHMCIGSGSFGEVFKVESKENGALYAIKVTTKNHTFDVREVERWEKVPPHENCVKYFMAWEERKILYIQMELCFTSLDKLVAINRNISEENVWDILLDVAQGLKNLHDHKLIHMDIKPANIMITETGRCKLGDFGLMVEYKEDIENARISSCNVSEGDAKYVSMETLREGIVSPAGDVFSCGIMLLELCSTKELPSCGVIWEELRMDNFDEFYNRDFSNILLLIIRMMMARDYKKRSSVDDILKDSVAAELLQYRLRGNRNDYVAPYKLGIEAYQRTLNARFVMNFNSISPRKSRLQEDRKEIAMKKGRKLF